MGYTQLDASKSAPGTEIKFVQLHSSPATSSQAEVEVQWQHKCQQFVVKKGWQINITYR